MVKLLSVVVSVYNEELALREFYQETGAVLKALPPSWDYELLAAPTGPWRSSGSWPAGMTR